MRDINLERGNGKQDGFAEPALRPDARRIQTDATFRKIADAETKARREKTERLKRRRLEASSDGV